MMRHLLSLILLLTIGVVGIAQPTFVGFTNDCTGIRFRDNSIPSDADRVVWQLDGVVVATDDAPFGTVTIFMMGDNITANYQRRIQVSPWTSIFVPVQSFPTQRTRPMPDLPPFSLTYTSGSYLNFLCPGTSTSVNFTANRCIPFGGWNSSIVEFFGSTNNSHIFQNLNRGGRGVTSTARLNVDTSPSLPSNGGARIRVTATATFGQGSRTQDILILATSNCNTSCPYWWCLPGLEEEDMQTLTAAQDGLSEAEWDAMDVDGAVNRYLALTESTENAPAAVQELSVYPNPATAQLNVAYGEIPATLRLVSLDGREVIRLGGNQLTVGRTRLDVSQLSTGLYLLEATAPNGKRTVSKVQINR